MSKYQVHRHEHTHHVYVGGDTTTDRKHLLQAVKRINSGDKGANW